MVNAERPPKVGSLIQLSPAPQAGLLSTGGQSQRPGQPMHRAWQGSRCSCSVVSAAALHRLPSTKLGLDISFQEQVLVGTQSAGIPKAAAEAALMRLCVSRCTSSSCAASPSCGLTRLSTTCCVYSRLGGVTWYVQHVRLIAEGLVFRAASLVCL